MNRVSISRTLPYHKKFFLACWLSDACAPTSSSARYFSSNSNARRDRCGATPQDNLPTAPNPFANLLCQTG